MIAGILSAQCYLILRPYYSDSQLAGISTWANAYYGRLAEIQHDFCGTLLQFKKEKISHHNYPKMIGVFPCVSDLIGTWIYDSLEQNRTKNEKLTQLVDIIPPPYNRERIQKSS